MARYEHLPIYKAVLDAAVHFEQVVAGFSRYHKYSLGTELRQASRGVIQPVIRANAARERLPQLLKLRDDLEAVLLLLRLAKEFRRSISCLRRVFQHFGGPLVQAFSR